MLLNDSKAAEMVKNIVFVQDGKLHFNQIAIDMLECRIVYYENLINLLQESGEEG